MTLTDRSRAGGAADGARVAYVLFDMSGVLAEFQGAQALGQLAGLTEQEVWPRWLRSPWMRRFDLGDCSAAEFADGIVEEWRLEITPNEFLSAFTGWMIGPYDGAAELVTQARCNTPAGCLSNMNPLHWDEIRHWPLTNELDCRFISCEIGLLKPDREIYEYAAAALSLAPSRILFLDDNLPNVEAARAAGMRSEHTRGVEAARAALRRHAVLPC